MQLNLAGDETSHGQWWGVPEIQRAAAKLEEKEIEEKVQAAEKEQQKIEKEMKKRQREKEKAETAHRKEIERQLQAKDKAEKARVRAAKKKSLQPHKVVQKSHIVVFKLSEAVHRQLEDSQPGPEGEEGEGV